MLDQIKGLHHITSMAKDARANNAFFTKKLGLRRVKKTVNFDAPDVYHLYYADEFGTPGSVMTYFPFPNIGKGRAGAGEVGTAAFSVPEGSLAVLVDAACRRGRRGPQVGNRLRRKPSGLRRPGWRRPGAGGDEGRSACTVDQGRRSRR